MSEVFNIGRVFPEKIIPKIEKGVRRLKGLKALPVGVFDSGVGGLTVLSEIIKQLPFEDAVYLADTARVPYGGRPPQEIIEINAEILSYFEALGVKMVVMACGTSSSIAHPVLKDRYDFPVISLIVPGAQAALSASRNLKIGLIATAGTVQSEAYQNMICELNPDAKVFAAACPLFVPLVEGGFIDSEEIRKVAREYLAPLLKGGIDTLILGCTHYPHLASVLRAVAGEGVVFIDPAESAVSYAKSVLEKLNLLNDRKHKGQYQYVVTGSVSQFEERGSRLLGRAISRARQIEL